MGAFYAHSLPGRPPSDWESMADHERRTAELCGGFLRRLDPSLAPWAEPLGRWHDLGKYQSEYQNKIRSEVPDRIQVEHSGMGAALASRAKVPASAALAFAMAGHHTGLANAKANDPTEYPAVDRRPLRQRLEYARPQLERLLPLIPESLLHVSWPELPRWLREAKSGEAAQRSYAFFTRMLFSSLVDSDRLATAEFYAKADKRPPEHAVLQYESLATLRDRLDAHIDRLSAHAAALAALPVNALRAEVLAACRHAAAEPPGIFSLTAPTGGGKTLAAMSFALRHAVLHGLDRVIVIIPFTSIIEQNADRYREALGVNGWPDDRNVLEHHSGIDEQQAEQSDRDGELRRRLAAENWDAPIVVSTSVQFFESLFSDHPSRCRKLHRIAKSVIILDEVQTLPPQLLLPILDAVRELADHYGASIVLSTATPPALTQRESLPAGLAPVRPIIPDPVALAASPAARRVEIEWRVERVTPYEELAKELAAYRQVLAVVHRRMDARQLAERLPAEGRVHLSALMCPAHRLRKIEEILATLRRGGVCRIASTQLIEAGVDIDLPVVYRALAGLDSLAQAAGRCDREGKLTAALGRPGGRLVVFRAETDPPPGTLCKAMQSTETLWRLHATEGPLDPFNPDHCELFFRELYSKEALDARNVQREQAALNFANVAASFRMIEDGWSSPVAMPWGEGDCRIEDFRTEPDRPKMRALQPFLVQVSERYVQHLAALGVVERWQESDLFLPTHLFGNRYSEEFGLIVDMEAGTDPGLLMV